MVKIIKIWFIKRELRRIEKIQYKVALNISKSANRSDSDNELMSQLIHISGYSEKIYDLVNRINILNGDD